MLLQTLFFVCAFMCLVTDAWPMDRVLEELDDIQKISIFEAQATDTAFTKATQPDPEKVLTVECSDGKTIQVPVGLLLISPVYKLNLKRALEHCFSKKKDPSIIYNSKRFKFSQIDSQTMKTVLRFMAVKLENGDIDTVVDQYINNMSIEGEFEAVFAVAKELKLEWLQAAMVKAGFRPPFICTKQDEKALKASITPLFGVFKLKPKDLSLKTLMCLKLAELYELKGTLEDTEFINLPQEVLEHAHVLHALQYGLNDGMIAPNTSLYDLAKAGIISIDTSGSDNKTDAEIIKYLVENHEIANLDSLLLLSRSNEWSKSSFNIPELLFEQLEKLDLQKLVDAIKLMPGRGNHNRVQNIYRLVLAVRDENNALNEPEKLRVIFWDMYYCYDWNLAPLRYFLNHKKLIELLGIDLIKEFLVVMAKDDDAAIQYYMVYKYGSVCKDASTVIEPKVAKNGDTIPSSIKAKIVKTMLCNKNVLELFNTDPGAVSELLEILVEYGHKKTVHEITSDSNYLSWSDFITAVELNASFEEFDTDEEPSV